MAYQFANPLPEYAFKAGCLYLGHDEQGREIGMMTERHAITIGGAGSGKGAALLVQNARRWTENLLMIDPKGENIELSWRHREAMGQSVRVLDPFKVANIPDRLRASFNPLVSIQPHGFTSREEVQAIADGLVKIHDPRHMEWVEGARAIIAGVCAYVIATCDDDTRNLASVRSFLLLPNEQLNEEAQRMLDCDACGGLARAAGRTIITAIESSKGMAKDVFDKAKGATDWLDSEPVAATLSGSSFDLGELKSGKCTVALVLPPHMMKTHAAYLRLFVRYALYVMAVGGSGKGRRCLFLLDEFFVLGKIEEIAEAAGLMRSYGVHLWPFLQDLGQLQELYGVRGAETFFGNADAHVFLGNSDMLTLEYVSKSLGVLTPEEVAPPFEPAPPVPTMRKKSPLEEMLRPDPETDPKPFHRSLTPSENAERIRELEAIVATFKKKYGKNYAAMLHEFETIAVVNKYAHRQYEFKDDFEKRVADENQQRIRAQQHAEALLKAKYEHAMRQVGSPRLTPAQLAALIGKGNGDVVARSMIVFAKAGAVLNLIPMPYFKDPYANQTIEGRIAQDNTLIEWDARFSVLMAAENSGRLTTQEAAELARKREELAREKATRLSMNPYTRGKPLFVR